MPWGAEYVLAVIGISQEQPSSEGPILTVSLTLQMRLLRARDGAGLLAATETHTGAGVTEESALFQAASRCLRPVLERLAAAEAP
ncbi:MAG: hypothetical protein KDD47_27430 [Acidobacteria bacterium]|nr:hypothetical protein [Acidobacteriota bacterium]